MLLGGLLILGFEPFTQDPGSGVRLFANLSGRGCGFYIVASVLRTPLPSRARVLWGMLTVAMGLDLGASVLFVLSSVTGQSAGGPITTPLGDLLQLASYGMIVAALLYLRGARERHRDWRVPTLDATATVLALGALTWVYVIAVVPESLSPAPLLDVVLQVAYPVLDFSMLLALLAARGANRHGIAARTFQLLAVYVVLIFLGDGLLGVGFYLFERITLFLLAGSLHAIGLMALAWAALTARHLSAPPRVPQAAPPMPAPVGGIGLSGLGTISVGLLFTALLAEQLRSVGRDTSRLTIEFVLFASAGFLGLLILLRQVLASRQERQFLEDYSHQLEATVRERTTQLADANQALAALVRTDALTGLPNRRHFDESMTQASSACRRAGSPLGLLMMDVDYFKRFNDTYGHQAGDECLRAVAQTVREAVPRKSDVVARYGGEEFAVICPGTDLAGLEQLANGIRRAMHDRAISHGAEGAGSIVTLSIGGAVLAPDAPLGLHEFVEQADEALYAAKHAGRDRFATSV